jgi:hypothetical protein
VFLAGCSRSIMPGVRKMCQEDTQCTVKHPVMICRKKISVRGDMRVRGSYLSFA